jgi:hypothetical protein
MAIAPEPYFSACMAVLSQAVLRVRVIGWSGEKAGLSPEATAQIADLMDAVHNLPHLVQHWERCDQKLLKAFLNQYDQKWHSVETGPSLLHIYEELLAQGM